MNEQENSFVNYVRNWSDRHAAKQNLSPYAIHAMQIDNPSGISDSVKREMGRVNFIRHPQLPLALYCYQKSASVSNMTPSEMAARGVVFEIGSGELVSWPMPKMLAWKEDGIASDTQVDRTFQKLDGSLIIAFLYRNEVIFTTKGSFDNPFTRHAYRFYNKLQPHEQEAFKAACYNRTLMFELMLPEHQIVVPVYQTSLTFLLSRHMNSGAFRFTVPDNFPFLTVKEIADVSQLVDTDKYKKMEDEEGLVCWVTRNDFAYPLKVKTDWYLNTQRAINRTASIKGFLKYVIEHNKLLEGYWDYLGRNDPEADYMYTQLSEIETQIIAKAPQVEDLLNQCKDIEIKHLSMWLKENYNANKKTHGPFFKFRKGLSDNVTPYSVVANELLIDFRYS